MSSRLPFLLPTMTTPSTTHQHQLRLLSTTHRLLTNNDKPSSSSTPPTPKLTHVTPSGAAHMVSISDKTPTKRVATAKCAVRFSDATALRLVRANQMKKGDVLGVARIAGIMAAKRTPDLIPLCHPIALTHAEVELQPVVSAKEGGEGEGEGEGEREGGGRIEITATVSCHGKTGVEMEALTAASAAALTVYDMCKAVDKGMVIEGLRVVLKEGGKSGRWVEGEKSE